MTVRFGALAAVAMLGIAPAVLAQAPGLPVMNGGVNRGFNLAGMVAAGNDAAGSGTAVGLTGSLGWRRIGAGAFVSALGGTNFDDGAIYAVGGNVTAKVLGGPLVPVAVNLQVGAGFHSRKVAPAADGLDIWQIPVGVGISWTIPRPVVALKPWISPRLEYHRISGPDPSSGQSATNVTTSTTDFGLSGGITFAFLSGIAIDVAVDRLFASGPAGKPTTIGVGLSLNRR